MVSQHGTSLRESAEFPTSVKGVVAMYDLCHILPTFEECMSS
jgi:hypothetical protein